MGQWGAKGPSRDHSGDGNAAGLLPSPLSIFCGTPHSRKALEGEEEILTQVRHVQLQRYADDPLLTPTLTATTRTVVPGSSGQHFLHLETHSHLGPQNSELRKPGVVSPRCGTPGVTA